MNIFWLNTDDNNEYRKVNRTYGAVGHYRIVQPWKLLGGSYNATFHNLEGKIRNETAVEDFMKLFEGHELIITKHLDNPKTISALVEAKERLGIPLIVDLDDDLWTIREDQPAWKKGFGIGDTKRAYMTAYVSFADGVIVSTNYLKKTVKNNLKKIFDIDIPVLVAPNCVNKDEWLDKESVKNDKGVVIGWHGSITHNSDLEMIVPVIKKVLEKYKDVTFELMGGVEDEFARKLFSSLTADQQDRCFLLNGCAAWDKFPSLLMEQKWDIGIAPLIDDVFNKSKSHIKWMEYALKGIPCIASDVKPYNDTYGKKNLIEHGKTGYLCKTEDEWVESLSILIENKELRKEIGNNAHDYVLDNWQYKDNIKAWEKAIKSVLKSHKESHKTLV